MPDPVNNVSRRPRNGPSRVGTPMERTRWRISRSMAERVNAAAFAAGMTGAAWVRGVLADRLGMHDETDRQPVTRYGGGGPDAAALTALRLQLRQTGGLITQGAKEARLAGVPTHPALEEALADIRAALRVLGGWDADRKMQP